jgi:phage N-6-adenine-methyltransferase
MSFIARTHPQQGPNEKVDDRETTPQVFAELDARLGPFTLDVAASDDNAKCPSYYTKSVDGLVQPWEGIVWCNPPYSSIRPWVEKAWKEFADGTPPDRIVMLLPANRTEQGWWQDLIEPARRDGSIEVEFIRGRMRFIAANDDQIRPNARPPFGVCLVIWGC